MNAGKSFSVLKIPLFWLVFADYLAISAKNEESALTVINATQKCISEVGLMITLSKSTAVVLKKLSYALLKNCPQKAGI